MSAAGPLENRMRSISCATGNSKRENRKAKATGASTSLVTCKMSTISTRLSSTRLSFV
ncbi:hypothetical protein MKQ70_35375 [Chitinophaga sedimenti]|uniref:hypothetical protein n=1 Tax=Chitinophaga sedimenti TaxID=2033606 RepID=UPI0020056C7E|nr:hypothetical protein [Chitinophaga sedimenti]MCK7559934.1 hypothetical protein [Chitinophaga sedimenti]